MWKTDIYLSVEQAQDKLEQLSQTINRDTLLSEEKAKFLEAQTKELKAINKKLDKANAEYEQEIRTLDLKKGELLDSILPIRTEIERLEKEQATLTIEVIENKSILEWFKDGMKTEMDRITTEHKALESKLSKEFKASEKKLTLNQEKLIELEKNIAEDKETISGLKSQALELESKQAELASINKEIGNKQNELKNISEMYWEEKAKFNECKLLVSEWNTMLEDINSEINKLTHIKEWLTKEIEEVNKIKFSMAKAKEDLDAKEAYIREKYLAAWVNF